MPITEDIMNHGLIGPAIRKGREEGERKGREEGERLVVLRLIEKRYGPLPEWEPVELRLLDAPSLEELLG